jgi:hypothetical protein
MIECHSELYNEGKIKIFNGSILDYNHIIKDHCFVVGLEILDNMPHDRLYSAQHQGTGSSVDDLTHFSTIKVTPGEINSKTGIMKEIMEE